MLYLGRIEGFKGENYVILRVELSGHTLCVDRAVEKRQATSTSSIDVMLARRTLVHNVGEYHQRNN
jgi:hypothetical protein